MTAESFKPRPTVIPFGKFGGTPIAMLSVDDLQHARREFSRADPRMGLSYAVARDVQASVMSELSRREHSAARRGRQQ